VLADAYTPRNGLTNLPCSDEYDDLFRSVCHVFPYMWSTAD
jgi:hypothetical protein